jgi:hypothetical protein
MSESSRWCEGNLPFLETMGGANRPHLLFLPKHGLKLLGDPHGIGNHRLGGACGR